MATTYTNDYLKNDFCDRLITTEDAFECSLCNLTIFSKHCFKGHHKLCYGKGYLGWKCNSCNKFFYRYSDQTSSSIKTNHKCTEAKKCRFCFQPNLADHICLMKKCVYPKTWPQLAFLSITFLEECDEATPLMILIYIEDLTKPGTFNRLIFSDLINYVPSTLSPLNMSSYYPKNYEVKYETNVRPQKHDFKANLAKLNMKNPTYSLKIRLLQHFMKTPNVTYICQDNNSTLLV